MATYKVIQDIEAEDKLLGPLTLRQFVYAAVTVACLYLSFFVATHGGAFFIIFIFPFMLLSAFFAFPWSREQPTELWALARLSFLFKPRKRIWDQSGFKELVTITVPKRIERVYSDGLTQTEVKSRLVALADTIDSRGWAIKNAVNPYVAPGGIATLDGTDRLIEPSTLPQDEPIYTETVEDVFDPTNGPKAQQFDSMLNASAQAHRQDLIETLQKPEPPKQKQSDKAKPAADYWFLNEPSHTDIPQGNDMFGTHVVTPGSNDDTNDDSNQAEFSTDDEKALTEELRAKATAPAMQHSHLPTILPLSEQKARAKKKDKEEHQQAYSESLLLPAPTVTAQPDTAILELARNDDLNIATIARQAKKVQGEDMNDEVVISLH